VFCATLALVAEVLLALAVAATMGSLRPRWSSLWAAVIPTGLMFAWLLLHEDIPGDPVELDDIVWYVGMSLGASAGFALGCSLGISVRRTSVRRRARLSR
jgi:hypothetical protein